MAPPRIPTVGERVLADGKEYIVTRVSPDGSEVDLEIPNTFLERFRIPTSTLIYPEKRDRAALHDPRLMRMDRPNGALSAKASTGRPVASTSLQRRSTSSSFVESA
jgi:hypothetical protein